MLGLVAVHIGAVLLSSWLHRENLVGAMITGRKPAPREQGVARARRGVALLLLASVLGFWAWQWQTAPAGGALPGIGTERHHGGDRDDD
jgi:hypothetical protein